MGDGGDNGTSGVLRVLDEGSEESGGGNELFGAGFEFALSLFRNSGHREFDAASRIFKSIITI